MIVFPVLVTPQVISLRMDDMMIPVMMSTMDRTRTSTNTVSCPTHSTRHLTPLDDIIILRMICTSDTTTPTPRSDGCSTRHHDDDC